jgi:hypothetical protein
MSLGRPIFFFWITERTKSLFTIIGYSARAAFVAIGAVNSGQLPNQPRHFSPPHLERRDIRIDTYEYEGKR